MANTHFIMTLCIAIGISDLDIIWELRFGIWDFRLVFRETNYYYLSPLESTLTLT